MMGRCPYGGQTWLYLNWLRGFARLGHEVWYVEDDTVWPYDPVLDTVTDDCRYAVAHVSRAIGRIGLGDRWAFRLADRPGACWGLTERAIDELYRSCDALLNIVGATDLRDEHMAAPVRVYVQTDPVGAELQIARGDARTRRVFERYHAIATYGENYGAADCDVPLNGLSYLKTRQPIDLELWPMAFTRDARRFTTIGNYRQTGSDIAYDGETYTWSKHHEWEKFMDLPRRTPQALELALAQTTADDRARLAAHGWHLSSPLPMSLDVFGAYPGYVRRSRAEFTVAKDQNVRLRSGWFSERDACYLASGKPVVSQDTGFGNVLPTGAGLFAVRSVPEAVEAIAAINADYRRQCEAARSIAEDCFRAEEVAGRLLWDLGL